MRYQCVQVGNTIKKLETNFLSQGFGCNEEELLGNGIPHGRKRSMFQGAAYKFYCESGSMMEGNSAVYCDGYSWNGTKPECLGKLRT